MERMMSEYTVKLTPQNKQLMKGKRHVLVVPYEGIMLDATEIRDFLNAEIAEYQQRIAELKAENALQQSIIQHFPTVISELNLHKALDEMTGDHSMSDEDKAKVWQRIAQELNEHE